MREYRSSEKNTEICVEFHELDVLFTRAILEHMSFIKNADIELEALQEQSIFFCASGEFICRNDNMKFVLAFLETVP